MWCWSCYCCYEGITYDISPVCEQEGKLCCLWTSLGSTCCCSDDGCIECSAKTCCCVVDGSIPAGYTTGIVCCGLTLGCQKLPEEHDVREMVVSGDGKEHGANGATHADEDALSLLPPVVERDKG